jgi:uncharacterized protein (DUF1330 family)
MAAYLFADLEVKDAAGYETYRARVGDTIAKYGGRFIVRGGKHEVLEGDFNPKRMVLLEFPSMEALQRWYNSPDYKPLIAVRKAAAATNVIAVEGV